MNEPPSLTHSLPTPRRPPHCSCVHVKALRRVFDDLDVGATGLVATQSTPVADPSAAPPHRHAVRSLATTQLPFVHGSTVVQAAEEMQLLPRGGASRSLSFPEFVVAVASSVARKKVVEADWFEFVDTFQLDGGAVYAGVMLDSEEATLYVLAYTRVVLRCSRARRRC